MASLVPLADKKHTTLSLAVDVDKMTANASLVPENKHSGSNNLQVSAGDKKPEIPSAPMAVKVAHAVTLVVAIINIILFAFALSEEERLGFAEGRLSSSSIPPLPANILSFFWSALGLVFVVILKRRIHPAFYIHIDLVAWLALVITGCLSLSLLISGSRGRVSCRVNGERYNCTEERHAVARLQYAACALSLTNAALHFPIMVWACRKMDNMNMASSGKMINISVDLNELQSTTEDPSPPYNSVNTV